MTPPGQDAVPTPHVWSSEALFAKAQLYTEKMQEEDPDEWPFCLWSTLALELLVRAAASSVSTALNASLRDSSHVLFAVGVDPAKEKFVPRTAEIAAVLKTLIMTGKGFTKEHENFCTEHLERRNKELHSGSTEMSAEASTDWLPRYYQVSQVLLGFLSRTLEDYVGPEQAKVAQQLIEAAEDESAKSVNQAIEASRTVWNAKPPAERDALAAQAKVWATRTSGHRQDCPACRSVGLLTGTPAGPATRELDEDEIVERQPFLPATFECVACGLRIAGLSKLTACGMGQLYTGTTRYSAAEYYLQQYAQEEGYEPDFNE